MNTIKIKLSALNFLNFAVWGSYLISLGIYLSSIGMAQDIYWFYTVQGLVSIIMPALIGIVADRWIQAQRMLSLCHLIAGLAMGAAGLYCATTPQPLFGPLFTLYTISVAFYMPTIGLANSVAYNALSKAGLDTVKHFPPIRVWGTVGFIVAMLLVNFVRIDGVQLADTYSQFFASAIFSLILAAYALTMPSCPTSRGNSASLADALGLKAFSLFRTRRMAVFFIFSMFLGVSLQITNSYGSSFISGFASVAEYAEAWGARNATALISLSQVSETLCILLIPYFLKRFGIKGVMLIAMFAWVFRFGFFGIGDTNCPGFIWLLLSCMVYGVAFDFFNVSGGMYVDSRTSHDQRSAAQGLFMLMTNGIGASLGTFLAGKLVVNKLVNAPDLTLQQQLDGWHESWLIFAAYALIVGVLFWIVFKERKPEERHEAEDEKKESNPDAGGMVEI